MKQREVTQGKRAMKQEKHNNLVFHTKRSNIIGFIKEKGFTLITYLRGLTIIVLNDPPFH